LTFSLIPQILKAQAQLIMPMSVTGGTFEITTTHLWFIPRRDTAGGATQVRLCCCCCCGLLKH
jgi:hypothetical protein